MKINAEFDQRIIVHSNEIDWIDSPIVGVSRRPLDRVGGEVARATSIVRYAPGSYFSPHVHTGGEEFFVLDGVFQDEHGDFPAGSYIRNPPQSSHTPGSRDGCIIFVKLWQFEMDDRSHVRIDTNHIEAIPHREMPGVSVTPLYKDEWEQVELQIWEPNSVITFQAPLGVELLVLDGSFIEDGDHLQSGSWLRLPAGSNFFARSENQGCRVWVKRHHLGQIDAQIMRLQNQISIN